MSGLFEDVVAGLSATPKTLPSKYLYDEEGSRLFEAITRTPEYYPTRVETALLREIAPEIAATVAHEAALVEFGSGSSLKTRLLLDAAPHITVYAPIDISPDALEGAAYMLRASHPALRVAPVVGDFTALLSLPDSVRDRPKLGFFPGSTLGNFDGPGAANFMQSARMILGAGSRFIVGYDLVKDEETLVAAYHDAGGVTAAFNLNLLTRLNRELGADFDLAGFQHRAVWNLGVHRMEMHLVSRRAQSVVLGGHTFAFATGETIHTENSYKFTADSFGRIAAAGGWRIVDTWTSLPPAFSVSLLEAF